MLSLYALRMIWVKYKQLLKNSDSRLFKKV